MPAVLQCKITNTVELFQVTLEWPSPGHKTSWLLYPWRRNRKWSRGCPWYSAEAIGGCRRRRRRK